LDLSPQIVTSVEKQTAFDAKAAPFVVAERGLAI
jgi:hypothetical protein